MDKQRDIAWVERWQRRHPRFAVAAYARLEAQAQAAHQHALALDALYRRYFVLEWLGEAGSAIDDLYAGLQRAEDLGLVHQAGRLLEAVGRVRYTRGEYRDAMHHWGRCVDLFDAAGDAHAGMEARIGLGAMYAALGDWAAGARFHRDARALLGGIDDPYLAAKLALNLGVSELATGRIDDAAAQFEQGLAEARRGGVREYVAEAHWHLGRCARERGDLLAAESLLRHALAQASACRYRWLTGAALDTLAQVQESLGRLDEAAATYEEALGHATIVGARAQQAASCAALSRLAERRGDATTALALARRHLALELEIKAELSAPDRLRQMQQYDLSEKPPVQKLLELSSDCATRRDALDTALHDVARAACDILHVAMAAVWLRDEADGSLQCRALSAPVGLPLQPGHRLAADSTQAVLCARLKQALPVHDARLHPAAREFAPLVRGGDIRSVLEVPLTLYGENVGLLSFGERGRRRNWTRDDALFGSHIAHVVAQMLSDRHHADNQERLAQANRSLEQRVVERTAELRQALQALEESSLTDPLTGLRNRRFLMQHLDVDAALAARRYEGSSRPRVANDADLVIFMVDIDHFKAVNDLHGHPAGDALLVQIKARLQRVFRESDYLVRWGGEEFLVVARSTAREYAEHIAERVRAAVADQPFELPDGTCLTKTCSIGFASYPFLVDDPRRVGWQEVVSLVDKALYAAKRAGRNAWVGVKPTDATRPEDLAAALKSSARGVVEQGGLSVVSNLGAAQVCAGL